MKRLLVFRHAKAAPHDATHDKQRPLVERGRDDAARMGRAMHDRGYRPDLVLCSSAQRTQETWNEAAPTLGARPEVRFLDDLYDASEKSVLEIIRNVTENAPVLMYIGHNPGLEQLAHRLIRKPRDSMEKTRAAAMERKFPTGAVAVIDFDIDAWGDIETGDGALSDFLAPAELKSG